MLKLQPFYIAANKANEYSFLSVSKLKKYFTPERYDEITKNEITSILGGTLHFFYSFLHFSYGLKSHFIVLDYDLVNDDFQMRKIDYMIAWKLWDCMNE